MLLSRSKSSASGRKDQKFRNKLKGKKKQKRLDAICEKAYNRSHRAVQKDVSSEINEGDNELELRRSTRARRAPVLLDSSPLPPKKRQKVDGRVPDRRQCQAQSSSSRDLHRLNGLWGPRLRSREKNTAHSDSKRGESSLKGKRKLYDVSDEDKDVMDPQCSNEKEGLASEKTTIVKSKRPGRIKVSNILINENQKVDLGGRVEDIDDDQGENEVFEVRDEIDGLHLEVNLECEREVKAEDAHMASPLDEKEEAAVHRDFEVEKCQNNGNVESNIEHDGMEILECDVVPGEINSSGLNCAIDDDCGNYRHPHSPLEDEMLEKEGKPNYIAVVERKPRIKMGRHCGLCWCGTDGKPPKILSLEGASSDEAYSGSSESEEPNYDVWDGFGDQSGWLGRLLGPINDRFGIAGIWVHQQCAVWSPEVYFAGLGCLKNVRAALYRGRVLKCSRCRRPGATIGCRVDRCPKTYHLPCARAKGCIFDHRKFLIVCTDHRHLFQPHGIQNALRLKRLKAKKMKLELRKIANDASQKDIEAEEKWLDNCGEDEEFLKREGKRLHRDLWRVAPTYIGGANPEQEIKYQGWESVAGLQHVIRCMKEVVILPLLYPEFFNNLGITPPRGVLLHGHPGTGKTLVVRALVGSCARGDRRIAYFARKGADCLGKYVGDAERQLRLLFQVAEKSQPSIIFFDEIDGLAPCRSRRQDQTHNSVVSTLLALMDGLKSRGSVIVIGATNRPDAVDPALRRPGRFDREIYFPLPSGKDREAILSLHTQKWPNRLSGCLLKWVAKQTVGFAGADLQSLCTQAAIIALRRSFPLQEVLLAAESRADKSKCPAIPAFAVEERDWLKALSCAAPPCSRRESGIAVNDVITSPLEVHLVPYLLQPLIRLILCLFLDENVWLPPHLAKASTLVKDVIVSILDRRGVRSDNWWLHMDGLLEEMDVINEIEKTIFTENVLVGAGENFTAIDRNVSEDLSDIPCNTHSMGVWPGLLSKMPHRFCSKSGYQVLICGHSKSGQEHLASCLLHFFVGNIDVWKVDLASIAHEGHGDMVQGLTHIMVGCARASVCMLYMPTIDLWAIETYDSTSEECEPSLQNPQSSGKICCDVPCGGDVECRAFASAEVDVAQRKPAVNKESYLWTSFVEQVESMRVNSCVIIMATSDLPFSSLPSRIRQFFGNGMVNCGLSSSLDRKVSQYSLQLDGQFDLDKVILHFASKLSKDLVQHFVQSLHGQCHVHEKLFEEKNFEIAEDVDQVCKSKSAHVSPLNLAGLTNKSIRVKSSLMLAISAVGYQILSYPHFAELCWVTSKLKEGPCADVGGPWKGWPFNSCIVRPCNSTEKGSAASGSGNIKHRESGLVRGLVAVGLQAYRGKYPSLREVCSEVRKVLETLVRRIDEKIHAGKDKTQFIRILSQVAYLDDMVLSWAQGLQSLEMDTHVLEGNPNAGDHKPRITGLHQYEALGKGTEENCAKGAVHFDPANGPHVQPNTDSEIAVKEPSNRENKPHEIDAKDAGCADPINTGNEGQDRSDDAITTEGSSHPVASCGFQSLNHITALNEVILEHSKAETDGIGATLGDDLYSKLPNGFTQESSKITSADLLNFQGTFVMEVPLSENLNRPNSMSLTDNSTLSKVTDEKSGGSDINVDYQANPGCLTGSTVDICFYQCCSKCSVTLRNLLVRIIKKEWGPKRANSIVDEAYDFLASLSANLHSSLHKLLLSGISCKHRKSCYCLGTRDKLLAKECRCHAVSKKISDRGGIVDWKFILNEGVVSSTTTLDVAGTDDVCYHCKFEKLCLSSLIDWLVMSKDMSLD